ncbi:predicted protein [Pyrenophora tritici-repentis Pt-1C-BFP]|uniref:Uncharacterized protein n=1 Tax=Pyrenophora tritici-repentis (strain Pt-1C-BFP) TaxID=426418 RepID=B2WN69_PYRTR|nr:uncharacterized protein PTRG_11518 [Pyrenophora tritici-repentis Pt-1C-BFP]EDU44568.1 predicted protein [Pyrenophora tritici-repentis Pt-1C-BFP]
MPPRLVSSVIGGLEAYYGICYFRHDRPTSAGGRSCKQGDPHQGYKVQADYDVTKRLVRIQFE